MSDLSHLSDARVLASTRLVSRAGRWLTLITIVFFTLAVWVDLRWLWMTLLTSVLVFLSFAASAAGVQELKTRNPDFKWDIK